MQDGIFMKITYLFLVLLIAGCAANKAPIVDAGQDIVVAVEQSFNFAGSATDDGKIVSYEWDANGDGVFDTFCKGCGKDAYAFNKEGVYTATLKVTDDEGAVGLDHITILVE